MLRLFIGLAALTVPHMILVDGFFRANVAIPARLIIMAEQTKSADRKDAHIALALDPLAMAAIDAGFDTVRQSLCDPRMQS